MKDLRIVIVSWNVEAVLGRCLRSLAAACDGLDWEAVVVDNASTDDSVGIATRISQQERRIRVMQNAENLGFGKACNLGTKNADARYVLYLNPDTECPIDTLTRLVQIADAHPKAGIIGPKLVYPSGRTQASVRRFPDVWSQAGILLKIHHLLPRLGVFQNYFAKDIDLEREQHVDQVMGACFLVRREFLAETGGFDERYFIWFEEVDWCRTAKQKGWDVLYTPQTTVIHHLGESFKQVFSTKRQRYFNRSLVQYFEKWHAGWQAILLKMLGPIALGMSWLIGMMQNPFVAWSAFIVALEATSALTIFHPVANSVAIYALGIAVLLLSWKKPVYAVGILLIELLIGSKGQLLQFGFWPVTTSGRIVLTAGFLAGWSMDVIQRRRWQDAAMIFRGRMQYGVLYLLIGYAVLLGIDLKNGSNVMKDANAWLDWVLLFPVLDVVSRHRESVKKWLAPAFVVSIMWLAIKTMGLEYLFSHGFKSIAPNAYLWVRRTGVAEVTLVVANAFRIFMQSYVYATAAFLMALAWYATGPVGTETSSKGILRNIAWPKGIAGPVSIISASVFILGISLSRSFWIGTAVGVVALIALLTKEKVAWWKKIWTPIGASLVGVMLIAATLSFPIPRVDTASLGALFGSRTNIGEEAAAVSRWNLIPVLWHKILEHPILGNGFGATVTYQSKDPRIIADTGTGMYTTYAFEWGWIEHWVKFGILGIPMMLWLLLSLGYRVWNARTGESAKHQLPLWLRAGFVSSLFALAALHFFTPYLNHPLGFLYFFVGESILIVMDGKGSKTISDQKV